MDFAQYVYTLCQTFFCFVFTVFWKGICLWFCHIVCVVFVLFFLRLCVCYVSLWLIPHPFVAITNLRIHGICVCVCVCFEKSWIQVNENLHWLYYEMPHCTHYVILPNCFKICSLRSLTTLMYMIMNHLICSSCHNSKCIADCNTIFHSLQFNC